MTLTTEILEAIKSAPEMVEWKELNRSLWNNYKIQPPCMSFPVVINYEWRIKPKPYYKKHFVFLSDIPNPDYTGGFYSRLLGSTDCGYSQTKEYPKKFEITVQEIVE